MFFREKGTLGSGRRNSQRRQRSTYFLPITKPALWLSGKTLAQRSGVIDNDGDDNGGGKAVDDDAHDNGDYNDDDEDGGSDDNDDVHDDKDDVVAAVGDDNGYDET
ncbi:hypothetical protein ElyMa_006680500 [Elysia marginata]|uniref:Uncharacterized protein n=1 Tax=Elysia marginata TaxID=1093978 RepID=A0AAV4IPZ4_9GAST|nr:hypothetical protein ElyMa_006680500 [Elysia marginata]